MPVDILVACCTFAARTRTHLTLKGVAEAKGVNYKKVNMRGTRNLIIVVLAIFQLLQTGSAFLLVKQLARIRSSESESSRLCETNRDADPMDGVVDLGDNNEEKDGGLKPKAVAPFLSQGEIDSDALNPDLSDPKQARVILYIIISLLPVLFLIPFMLGSRDLVPLDPVQM